MGSSTQNVLPITAYQREFKGSGGKTIYYIHFQGYGYPNPEIGQPGDMFIDMSSDARKLFIRGEEWQEWRGVYRSAPLLAGGPIFQFQHPKDTSRTVWCSPMDIVWYKKKSFYKSRARLFAMSAHAGSIFIPAHELLSKTAILLNENIPSKQHGECSGKKEGDNLTPGGRSSNPERPPTKLRSATRPFSDLDIADSTSQSTQPGIRSGTRAPKSTSSRPPPTKDKNILSIHNRSFESRYSKQLNKNITYIEYRGIGIPPITLGSSGDLFIDQSPNAHRIFVRYKKWSEWPGIHKTAGLDDGPHDGDFFHPEDPTRVVWCTHSDVKWLKVALIRHWKAQHFAGEPANASFISSHTLVSRLNLGVQIPCKRKVPISSGSGGDIKRRKVFGERSTSMHNAPEGVLLSPEEPLRSPRVNTNLLHPSSATLLNTHNTSTILSQQPSELESLLASPQKDEPTEDIPENLSIISEAVEELEKARRIKELQMKRSERYQSRQQELALNEVDITAQEQQLLEVEKQTKVRLGLARQDAFKKREENRLREEELRREKEELTVREGEVFQRERAIKRRKELIAQMENMIKRISDES